MAPLNALTAEPTLRLMLAEAGYEPQLFPFGPAYAVFKQFMLLPSQYAQDAASFQVTVLAEPGADPLVSVILGREMRWKTGDDLDPGVRRVLLQFDYGTLGPNVVESSDLWSSDYSSLSLFWATLEGTEEYREAKERSPDMSGLFVEEESGRAPHEE